MRIPALSCFFEGGTEKKNIESAARRIEWEKMKKQEESFKV
jgi:hypothetical protein